MLVLTRKEGERVRIGTAVVSVNWVRGGAVSLGIDAPQDVLVLREELPPRGVDGDGGEKGGGDEPA